MVGGFFQSRNMEEEKELTREQRIDIEEKAIQALLQMGVRFSVPLKIKPRKQPKYVSWWNRHFPGHVKIWRDKRIPKGWDVTTEQIPSTDGSTVETVYMRHFYIKPLYLGTIDMLRGLYLKISYDEEAIEKEPLVETKKYFKYIPQMAEIAAVAVINDPSVAERSSKQVKDLKDFFLSHLTVSRLQRLADVISQMMNAGGFTYSIRSIREVGTTKPHPTKAAKIE